MSHDVVDLRRFYASSLGHVARRVIGRVATRHWNEVRGSKLVGLGYAVPYLNLWQAEAERVFAFMPASQGVVGWCPDNRDPVGVRGILSASALVDPLMLPLDDASVDRVLVVHALEASESAEELLAECWRVLAPGGRVMLVVPNRRGLWARMDATPFGHGRPFSRRQLERLMREALFSPENWSETLFTPPINRGFVLRATGLWEKAGGRLGLPFSGVHVIDATKQFYRRAIAKNRRAFALRHLLAPIAQPAPSAGRTLIEEQKPQPPLP